MDSSSRAEHLAIHERYKRAVGQPPGKRRTIRRTTRESRRARVERSAVRPERAAEQASNDLPCDTREPPPHRKYLILTLIERETDDRCMKTPIPARRMCETFFHLDLCNSHVLSVTLFFSFLSSSLVLVGCGGDAIVAGVVQLRSWAGGRTSRENTGCRRGAVRRLGVPRGLPRGSTKRRQGTSSPGSTLSGRRTAPPVLQHAFFFLGYFRGVPSATRQSLDLEISSSRNVK